MSTRLLALFLVAGLSAVAADPPKIADYRTNVKAWTDARRAHSSHDGIVTKVTDKSITVAAPDFWELSRVVSTELFAVDQLGKGKLLDNVSGPYAYLLSDVKVGDYIRTNTAFDDDEKRLYCCGVSIKRRPGGKLPQSQKPDEDKEQYAKDSLRNDIDNGNDVSDDDVASAFPPKFVLKDPRQPNSPKILDRPGGLDKEYQAKLDAIRAKKKKAELKATPPEKK